MRALRAALLAFSALALCSRAKGEPPKNASAVKLPTEEQTLATRLHDVTTRRAQVDARLEKQRAALANESGAAGDAQRALLDARVMQLGELEEALDGALALYQATLQRELESNDEAPTAHSQAFQKEAQRIMEELQEIVVHNQDSLRAMREQEAQRARELQRSRLGGNGTHALPGNTTPGNATGASGPGPAVAPSNDSAGVTMGDSRNGSTPNAPSAPMLDHVLDHVMNVADEVEEKLRSDAFATNRQQKGATLQTVVKVAGDSEGENDAADDAGAKNASATPAGKPKPSAPVLGHSNHHGAAAAVTPAATAPPGGPPRSDGVLQRLLYAILGPSRMGVPMLIDADNNAYALARPSDLTAFFEDGHLVWDLAVVLIFGLVGALVAAALDVPLFFGHIAAGIAVGPMGLDLVHSLVQVETLANSLGAMFIMALLGLEFNVAKLRRVWKTCVVAVLVPPLALAVVLVIVGAALWGALHVREALAVGATLSLSSTAVVLRMLPPREARRPRGHVIMGVIVLQDMLLGALLALLPIARPVAQDWRTTLRVVGRAVVSFAAFAALCLALGGILRAAASCLRRRGASSATGSDAAAAGARTLSPSEDADANAGSTSELKTLAAIAVIMWLGHLASAHGLSSELGCFAAGVILSQLPGAAPALETPLATLRDFFASYFFAAIGFHINLYFFVQEAALLLLLTAAALVAKLAVMFGTLRVLLRHDIATAAFASAGLASISEFAFLLCAHMKALGILPREGYYLLLGTTALSMLCTPALFWVAQRLIALWAPAEYSAAGAFPTHLHAGLPLSRAASERSSVRRSARMYREHDSNEDLHVFSP